MVDNDSTENEIKLLSQKVDECNKNLEEIKETISSIQKINNCSESIDTIRDNINSFVELYNANNIYSRNSNYYNYTAVISTICVSLAAVIFTIFNSNMSPCCIILITIIILVPQIILLCVLPYLFGKRLQKILNDVQNDDKYSK